MTPEELDAIEARQAGEVRRYPACDMAKLIAEVRALRVALAELREWTHDEHCSHDTGDYSDCDLTPEADALLDGGKGQVCAVCDTPHPFVGGCEECDPNWGKT